MSIDLCFWKCRDGVVLDNAAVYQEACCGQQETDGLETLPIEEILKETAAVFNGWHALDPCNYEKEGGGSFQVSVTPQTVRFDCYSMGQADMKRFSSMMAKFGCPLYDPQLGARFDKIAGFLIDEAADYQDAVGEALARLLPRMELALQAVSWDEYTELSKTLSHVIRFDAGIHRAKTITKATSYMRFGKSWAARPCQCKTAQLADPDSAHQVLAELLQKSIERVVKDFFERTYYD
jgi:hypothetical protein